VVIKIMVTTRNADTDKCFHSPGIKKSFFIRMGYPRKNADRDQQIKMFFHSRIPIHKCRHEINSFFSIARIPNIKMQTGNQIVFPLPEYQYTNADMKSIHFSIARIPNIKMQTGNQIVFPLPEYQYTTQIIT
jgi:hypothetical protein